MVNITSGFDLVYYFCNSEQEFEPSGGDEELTDANISNPAEMSSRSHKEAQNLVNEGPGGQQVYSSEKPRSGVCVGELIGLQAGHGLKNEWLNGAVRWLMIKTNGSHKISIEAMNKDIQLAAVRTQTYPSSVDLGHRSARGIVSLSCKNSEDASSFDGRASSSELSTGKGPGTMR